MKERELRLGNYFFIGGIERYVKVSAVFLSHFKCTDENGIDFNNHQNNIKPIELTEEILLKCGFVAKNEYDYFCLNGIKISSTIMRCDTKERSCFYLYLGDENEILNNRIDYLHQLQNLYFALTNEELEIQL